MKLHVRNMCSVLWIQKVLSLLQSLVQHRKMNVCVVVMLVFSAIQLQHHVKV